MTSDIQSVLDDSVTAELAVERYLQRFVSWSSLAGLVIKAEKKSPEAVNMVLLQGNSLREEAAVLARYQEAIVRLIDMLVTVLAQEGGTPDA